MASCGQCGKRTPSSDLRRKTVWTTLLHSIELHVGPCCHHNTRVVNA